MRKRFTDRVVWITGASSGIGAAAARRFHDEGAHLALSARNAALLDDLAKEFQSGGEVLAVPFDVADEAETANAAAMVAERFGRVDVLFNNAGIAQRSRVADTDMTVYRRIMEVNFFGAVALTKAVLPVMLARGSGQIVCTTSVAGKYGSAMRSGYNASKHAMHGFFDSLREEVEPKGIGVTLIVPGAVRTNVSVNALRGDGSFYGKMDAFLENGISPEECARRTVDAVHARRDEVVIARGAARRHVILKRLSGRLLTWDLRR